MKASSAFSQLRASKYLFEFFDFKQGMRNGGQLLNFF